MKKSHLISFVLLLTLTPSITAQNDTLNLLFRNSYGVFELLRNDLGIYRDAKKFTGSDFHPASTASIGMGLVAVCIAHEMNWIEDAEEQILATLESLTGNNPPFNPDRNASGYFRHWISMTTGEQAWNSEYSTIDTGILMAGTLFSKKVFSDSDCIAHYADLLWESIDWSKAIQNPQTGGIFREMQENGEGKSETITLPFNEYMLVAWLAMNQEASPGKATELWNNHYAHPNSLPTKNYQGIEVLTDHPSHFLSSFVIQFPYYLCHHFTTDESYLHFFDNARKADSLWWATEKTLPPYKWGLGAGPVIEGYHADAINNNPSCVYSPHIIAGFLPTYPAGQFDLIELYKEGEAIYTLPNEFQSEILWRRSRVNPSWSAGEVQGVDFSTMLFGLATLPQFLGVDFFRENNNFFEGSDNTDLDCASVDIEDNLLKQAVAYYPNPTNESLSIEFTNSSFAPVYLTVFSIDGRVLLAEEYVKNQPFFKKEVDFSAMQCNVLVVQLQQDGFMHSFKVWLM